MVSAVAVSRTFGSRKIYRQACHCYGGVRRSREGGSNSAVESQPSKLLVAGSIPVSRSSFRSLIERVGGT
jgi:hypothetical protein